MAPLVQAEPAREQMNEVGSTVTPGGLAVARPGARSHPDPVSSHILDTTLGRPAVGVSITMSRLGGVNQVRHTEIYNPLKKKLYQSMYTVRV